MNNENEKLSEIILKYREELQKKIKEREAEMQSDNNEHYMLYNALGFTSAEGYQIDFQQNVGRFLYKYAGYTPVRMMFFEPNREQAIRIQSRLRNLYHEIGGEYYAGKDAWNYLLNDTGIDLKTILERSGK